MSKTFKLDDEQFYKMLSGEVLEHFESLKTALENKFIPVVKIMSCGARNSWYNSHIGKSYEIYRYSVSDNGYINFLVKSGNDGTKSGYKSRFSLQDYGKGIDIVHAAACEIAISFPRQTKQ